jgi:hypothetical protein
MDLHLSDDDAGLLRELLSNAFRDLRYEIADTDNHEYKQGLKDREARLKTILDQLGGLLPAE